MLTLIAGRDTIQGIALALRISVETVKRHRSNIMEKLNLHNRIELTKHAIRKGLIEAHQHSVILRREAAKNLAPEHQPAMQGPRFFASLRMTYEG